MASDAFGRLRVSDMFSLFDYYVSPQSTETLDVDIWVGGTTGTGTITYNSANNYIKLLVQASGDYAIRYTKIPMEYQPGKSRLLYISGTLLSGAVNSNTLVARVGLFNVDTSNPPADRKSTRLNSSHT